MATHLDSSVTCKTATTGFIIRKDTAWTARMTNFGETYHHTNQGKNSMDCDITLEMIDAYLLEACKTAEYCAMTHREGVVAPYRRAVVDPYVGGPLSCTIERKLCPLVESELYLFMKRSP